MFTLQKLAVLIAIIGAAWYGFRWFERLQELRRSAARRSGDGNAAQVGRQDLLECRACGTYVARGGDCGRADCPQTQA